MGSNFALLSSKKNLSFCDVLERICQFILLELKCSQAINLSQIMIYKRLGIVLCYTAYMTKSMWPEEFTHNRNNMYSTLPYWKTIMYQLIWNLSTSTTLITLKTGIDNAFKTNLTQVCISFIVLFHSKWIYFVK